MESMIYIHIPFCASKCAYCDFYSRPGSNATVHHDYVDTLLLEWDMRRHEIPGPVTSVYIGGGTPSLLNPSELDRLLNALPLDHAVEITIEANPEQIDVDFLSWLRSSPVNRLSLGVQSFDDSELQAVGRRHSATRALEALDEIVSAGISNYSIDLIYGLPGQTYVSWERSLTQALRLAPAHLSCYMLSYEPGTRLNALRLAGKLTPADDDMLAAMYTRLCQAAAAAGYEHYEISNFARPGRRSLHNTGYWTGRPYLGLGASAHSYDGVDRRFNPPDLRRYMAVAQGSTVYTLEAENDDERHNDDLLTGLRMADGIDLRRFAAAHGEQAGERLRRLASDPSRRHLLAYDRNRLRFTEQGWLLSDAVLVDLFV